ncbi:SMP-30/gluconolactonase/LRE family protein [Brevibacterium daeguense]|uniref:SMP-30/gluconolactonase/LRE family protein n=1 Tax=Brevibacterium daeguense TaxID=909936 RepID=A0ABP8EGS5_9MICO|nr:SMP-30/gluconolactonase/LRE family protein [Brevibacterium daeguense]
MATDLEQLTPDGAAYHGEGPCWSPSWGGIRWLDMLAGDVLGFGADGGVSRTHVGDVVACVRPRRAGGAVLGIERGFALEEPDGRVVPLAQAFTDTSIRMNEGGVDPDGRFYCGSMAYDQSPGAAALYRLDPDGTVSTVLTGVTVSNGLDWSPDGTRAYYNDTATGRIDVFDYERVAGLVERRPFVRLSAGERPDGLTVDSEGGVWTAIINLGQVRRYSVEGELDEVIELPAAKVTACAFGGEELDELFITTSAENLPAEERAHAGALWRARPGVTGQPVRCFAG